MSDAYTSPLLSFPKGYPMPKPIIAFQGAPGAYSDLACREVFPHMESLACRTFEDTFAAVVDGQAGLAMIPVDNSIAGRVADIHHLLPQSGLHIIGEHYHRVHHNLLACEGVSLTDIQEVHSHVHAIGQCREYIKQINAIPVIAVDTAGSAKDLAQTKRRDMGVIASKLAAEIYGLSIVAEDVEDVDHNTTRFLIMGQEPIHPDFDPNGITVTSFLFTVRSVPAALYKCLGGFATNGVNLTKLESYITSGSFENAQFYADIEGHPDERRVQLAMEELGFFSRKVDIRGVYQASPYRSQKR